jgi:hypothetical protein
VGNKIACIKIWRPKIPLFYKDQTYTTVKLKYYRKYIFFYLLIKDTLKHILCWGNYLVNIWISFFFFKNHIKRNFHFHKKETINFFDLIKKYKNWSDKSYKVACFRVLKKSYKVEPADLERKMKSQKFSMCKIIITKTIFGFWIYFDLIKDTVQLA